MADESDWTKVTMDCEGGMQEADADPCIMVIFGASGDLTRRSLIPSLAELVRKDLLPSRFAVLGMSRSDWSDDEFRNRMRDAMEGAGEGVEDVWDDLAPRLHYISGNFDSEDDFRALSQRLGDIANEAEIPNNLYFHLATPPSFFGTIAQQLTKVGLASADDGWRRLVIEKPFGEDRASARALHEQLSSAFSEDQIYRVDHFLGKETVQNMLVVRFANPSFEPVWNNQFIDHVQITVAEDIGIGTRGSFYESTGVVRDMIQNHLLQLLCMTAVEPPVSYDARSLRDETVKVLRAIHPPDREDVVFGQYGPGTAKGKEVVGYRQEDRVSETSQVPTLAALKLEVDTWRWSGVPFYLRTGKRMAQKLTEVAVHFKPTPHLMFDPAGRTPVRRSVIVFRLQPEEGIFQTFVAKQPGPQICLTPVTSRFLYADAFGIDAPPRAYSWLILDVMEGQQALFARDDWVDQAWAIVDPVVEMGASPRGEYPNYEAGTWGPKEVDDLLARDGRSWREF